MMQAQTANPDMEISPFISAASIPANDIDLAVKISAETIPEKGDRLFAGALPNATSKCEAFLCVRL